MTTEDSYDGPERRRAPRLHADLHATVATPNVERRCRVVDVSALGACAISDAPSPEMTDVRLRFEAKDKKGRVRAIECVAAVVRCTRRPDGKYDLGLFFTSVTDEDRAAIVALAAASRPAPVER